MNIRSVSHSEIAITFGDDMCIVRSSSDTVSDFAQTLLMLPCDRRLVVLHQTSHQAPH